MLSFLLAGCSAKSEFEVKDFEPLSDFNTNTSLEKVLYLDYENAIDSGFVIPSPNQIEGGMFTYRFKIRNNSGIDAEFMYKLYYQNETYSFEEINDRGKENPQAAENFYGSFEDASIGFISTGIIPSDGNFHTVEGKFRITGNPRDEKRYYGTIMRDKYYSQRTIEKTIEAINNSDEWIAAISEKAKSGGISLEEQIRMDAEYIVMIEREKDTLNQRWKRNPRTGSYSFLLATVKRDDIMNIPLHVQYINKVSETGTFVNPYYYYLHEMKGDEKIVSSLADKLIYVKAKPDLSKGIYFSKAEYPDQLYSRKYFSNSCGCDSLLYHNAQMQQFFHKVDKNEFLYNIPLIADVNGDAFNMEEYRKNEKMHRDERTKSLISITDCPCRTVGLDSSENIFMTNPSSVPEKMRKENVGVFTRHGMSYGKYRVKVKMPSLLNKYNVWNGLTNAIWMITQSPDSWNNRRVCETKGGYMPKHVIGVDTGRVPVIGYTEIDFEILKCNRYWPVTSYADRIETPKEGPEDASKIVITCTNWDMACQDPKNFNIGYCEYDMMGKKWGLHRWDKWFQALTAKYPIEDVFDNDYYYFEIEWKPREITWRVGPEKDKMFVVGYVNDSISSISDNQMMLVFTQEYHVGRWWPESAMPQENIPFSAKDIKGYIMEIEIE